MREINIDFILIGYHYTTSINKPFKKQNNVKMHLLCVVRAEADPGQKIGRQKIRGITNRKNCFRIRMDKCKKGIILEGLDVLWNAERKC